MDRPRDYCVKSKTNMISLTCGILPKKNNKLTYLQTRNRGKEGTEIN